MNLEEIAIRQVNRCRDLPGFPESAEGLTELVNAVWRWANSESHAHEIVTHCMDTNRFCPTPADIAAAAQAISAAVPTGEWRPNMNPCPKCLGSGFEVATKGGYSGAKPCSSCRSTG